MRALLAGWAALSLVFLGLLKTAALGRYGTVVLDDYGTALAATVAAVACMRAGRRVRGRSRLAWLLMAASSWSWAAGEAIWTVYEVYLGWAVPFPSLADAGYLLGVPLAVAALLAFPGDPAAGAARLRPLLDGVIAAGALLFASWTTVLGPAFHAGDGSVFSQTISLAYPATDVLTASIALLALARTRPGQRVGMLLIGSGLLIITVADSAFTWFTVRDAYDSGNLFDTGWVAGYLLIGIAALWVPARGSEAELARTPAGTSITAATATRTRLAMTLPYLPLAVTLPMAVGLQFSGRPLGRFQVDIILVVVVAVLLRQLLSLQVILGLSRQLNDTVATLRGREAELHLQAFHDPLTGLANRALFADRISHALARTRGSRPVILLLADLDDFKAVNDTLGHAAGDALLVAVAERLRAIVRPEDTVARLGGDEFAVLLETADDLADAQQVADRIAQALLAPFRLAGVSTVIAASIGIAGAGDAATGEALLRDADIAMYAAKAEGKGRYAVYALELATANTGRLQLKTDLSEALARGELSLKYQPIIDLETGHMRGVEALLRWTHPVHGAVPPGTFIALAEASGAILPIGRWVLAQACAQAGLWEQARPEDRAPLSVAVNVSGRQLSDPLLIPAVRAALADARLPPDLLTLEITEGVLLDDTVTVGPMLALQALGVHLAIDDFGTGHSALSRLRRYPVDTLKIDQSFIAALTPDAPVPDVVIAAILSMGHGLGMDVIAEGVETPEQLAALRHLGCPLAQGFLFARPADPEVIGELIRAGIALTDPVDTASEASRTR